MVLASISCLLFYFFISKRNKYKRIGDENCSRVVLRDEKWRLFITFIYFRDGLHTCVWEMEEIEIEKNRDVSHYYWEREERKKEIKNFPVHGRKLPSSHSFLPFVLNQHHLQQQQLEREESKRSTGKKVRRWCIALLFSKEEERNKILPKILFKLVNESESTWHKKKWKKNQPAKLLCDRRKSKVIGVDASR